MRKFLVGLALVTFVGGNASAALADATVVHKESADGERSKTVIDRDNGSRTIIKRHGDRMKKVHIKANGDKVIVKKEAD